MVREDKVCAWLQDEVLQRVISPRRARGHNTKASKAHTQGGSDEDEEEIKDDDASSSEEEDSPGQPLTLRTVKGYINAIAELHRWQVSDGSNSWTVFRGPALKGLMTDLARTQVKKDRESFADVAAGGISAGYSSEEFLRMSQQLLSGAAVKIQVSLLCSMLYIIDLY